MLKDIIKKVLFFLILGLIFMKGCFATTYQDRIKLGPKITNLTVTKKHDGRTWHDYVYVIQRQSDNQYVYCIQPGVSIDASANYTGSNTDWEQATNLTTAQLKRVELLAYYGFEYNEDGYNHNDNKWYAVTQMLIWRTVGTDWDIYFTDSLGGNKLSNQYIDEIAELETLVANHDDVPDFGAFSFNLDFETELVLTDHNQVLDKFIVQQDNENIILNTTSNTLIINSLASGKTMVEFIKNPTRWSEGHSPIVYINPTSQNVYRVGNFMPLKMQIEINVFPEEIIVETEEPPLIPEETTIEIPVPNTGIGADKNIYWVTIAGMICSFGVIVYDQKLKK